MEERISGFRIEGDWVDVVEHGDRIAQALRNLGPTAHPRMEHEDYRAAVREWEDWRPRRTEDFHEDVRPRTAEKASVPRGKGERRGKDAGEDLEDASRTLVAPESRAHVDASLIERVAEAGKLATRAVDTGLRSLFRELEETIYEHLMTRMAPCYFDNRVLSANIERRSLDADDYTFEININNDELKEKVRQALEGRDDVEERAWPSAA